jgi:hypothetical protein
MTIAQEVVEGYSKIQTYSETNPKETAEKFLQHKIILPFEFLWKTPFSFETIDEGDRKSCDPTKEILFSDGSKAFVSNPNQEVYPAYFTVEV